MKNSKLCEEVRDEPTKRRRSKANMIGAELKIGSRNQSQRPSLLVLFLIILLPAAIAGAQQYKLAWSNTKGGGGTHSNGRYTLSGTIGQPEAGVLTNSHYALNLGFQRIVAVLQTLGAPHLTITRSGMNVVVSWPSPSTGFTLQTNGNLSTTNWVNYGGIVGDNGTLKTVTNAPPTGTLFFRLKQ